MSVIRLLYFAAILTSVPILSTFADVARPICPVVYASSSGGFKLFWFYPDLNVVKLGNVSDYPEGASCVGYDTSRQYCLLTRFRINPPVLVSSASTFISGEDLFPDSPGDQFTPIIMSLKSAISPSSFSNYSYWIIGLDSFNPPLAGEVVTADIGISLTGDFEVWVGLEWLKGFPKAPVLGTIKGLQTLEQYACEVNGSVFDMQECQDNYLVGMDLLGWSARSEDSAAGYDRDDSLFFEIRYAADTCDFDSSSVPIDTIGRDSLLSEIEMQENGYVCILASDGITSVSSDFVCLNNDSLAPVTITPVTLEGQYGNGRLNDYTFRIENKGQQALCALLKWDSDLICLAVDSVCVEGGTYEVISFSLHDGIQPDSGIIKTEIIIIPENKYPILYNINLKPSDPTSVETVSDDCLEAFFISQGQPNPFNGGIGFDIYPVKTEILLFEVFNLLGQRLYSRCIPVAGVSRAHWDAVDESGKPLPSGIYFFRFSADSYSACRKAILIK